ncbi:MAG TPA: molybdopterin-dependent oxidoreductase [Mycobacterium sp.]|nr:molybdopterin-dependent oxidoreductase [Mycobacterium sp.]HQC76471.1 molybdopterin-dependent oxidoreductase [Mycobacterium sp.]
MATEQKTTYCRICESVCGMVATVEDGRLVALRPDKDHPLSEGFACQKGIAFSEVVNDPDRVTTPLRRTPDGGFEQVGWDQAMADIALRLSEIHARHGAASIGWYAGNPGAFSYDHIPAVALFLTGLGRRSHLYTASSQDSHPRLMASQLLYGYPLSVPFPDLSRTELLVVMGANPVVSHGSLIAAPRMRERMHAIVKRGGRVLVIDPRRTETAAQFEWLGIQPDGDALLLLSLLQVMFAEGLVDSGRAGRQADGIDWLAGQCAPFAPESTESATGVPAETVRALARDLVRTPRAAVYGRLGTCAGQRSGTLTTYLLDAVNLVAGNLDVPGGSVFGSLGIPGESWVVTAFGALLRRGYRKHRTRIGGFGNVVRSEPATLMAKEIEEPGTGQIRALFVSAGNPVLSVPNGPALSDAMKKLDLSVALDFYVTETTAQCDYILPTTTMYEREDFPLLSQTFLVKPFRQATRAVIEPRGQSRTEWDIIDDLMQRMSGRTRVFSMLAGLRSVARAAGRRFSLRPVVDGIVRFGPGGDLGGLRRGGLSFDSLPTRYPHGKVLSEDVATGVLAKVISYRSRRVQLVHNEIDASIKEVSRRVPPPEYPLRLIGMREPRSENSWMHNSPLLMRGDRGPKALMHVADAARRGIADGDDVAVRSPYGKIALPATLTEDIVPGAVAIPHGWGHRGGGWQVANRAGGVNVNELTSDDPDDVEPLSGMAWLNGVPIEVERT